MRPRKALLKRLPSSVGGSQALDDLQEKLAIATEFFDHHGDGGRQGVFQAILAVVDYFSGLGIPRASLTPISAIAMAITDADHGTESAIFKPERDRRGGKPRTGTSQVTFEGHLATVTECCVLHCRAQGMRPFVEPACRLAAKMVNQSNWSVEVTAKELREIRERVQQSARSSPDRILLEIARSSEVAIAHPMEWAKLLLADDRVVPPPTKR